GPRHSRGLRCFPDRLLFAADRSTGWAARGHRPGCSPVAATDVRGSGARGLGHASRRTDVRADARRATLWLLAVGGTTFGWRILPVIRDWSVALLSTER